MLEDLIAKGRTLTLAAEESDDEEEEEVEIMTVHCVTCGSNVQVETAIKHMSRCYNKVTKRVYMPTKACCCTCNSCESCGFCKGRVQDLVCVQVQDPDRRPASVLRLLQPEGAILLQATQGALSRAQPRCKGEKDLYALTV